MTPDDREQPNAAPEDPAAEPSPGQGLPRETVLARLEDLAGTLKIVAGSLQTLSARERRTRRLAVGLVVSFVIDIALTVAVSLLSVSTLHQGDSIHASQLVACAIANGTRNDQITLWDYVIALSEKGPQTPQSRAELAALHVFVDKTFAVQDCAALYPG